jgi:hypothetical protein
LCLTIPFDTIIDDIIADIDSIQSTTFALVPLPEASITTIIMTATSLPAHIPPSSAPSTSRDTAHIGNLWSEILESASRRGHRLARKHVVVLGECEVLQCSKKSHATFAMLTLSSSQANQIEANARS